MALQKTERSNNNVVFPCLSLMMRFFPFVAFYGKTLFFTKASSLESFTHWVKNWFFVRENSILIKHWERFRIFEFHAAIETFLKIELLGQKLDICPSVYSVEKLSKNPKYHQLKRFGIARIARASFSEKNLPIFLPFLWSSKPKSVETRKSGLGLWNPILMAIHVLYSCV